MGQHEHRVKQMVRRRAQGMTYSELGDEFGLSSSHVHRLIAASVSPVKNIVKNPSPEEYKEE